MRHNDAVIRQRVADIVQSIRPLPADIRPSEAFIRDTRTSLLAQPFPVSLASHRRGKAAARADVAKRGRQDVA